MFIISRRKISILDKRVKLLLYHFFHSDFLNININKNNFKLIFHYSGQVYVLLVKRFTIDWKQYLLVSLRHFPTLIVYDNKKCQIFFYIVWNFIYEWLLHLTVQRAPTDFGQQQLLGTI